MAWPERIVVVRGKPPIRGGYLRPSKEDQEDQEDQAEKSDPEEDAPATSTEEFLVAKPKEGEDKQEPLTVEEATKMAEDAARAAEAGDGSDARVMRINMMHMIQKGEFSQNVLLKSGDVVYVPPNPLAAVGLALQQLLFPILPAAQSVSAPASAAREFSGIGGGGR
jgi:protein involved in polysaccharide export with SLBB domain